jgi:two-component system chemotaxis sensor kinase CheA
MDTSEYVPLFLEEATEQINILEQNILLLEQSPSQETLNEIFRAAHTLKGSSRAMGFTAMGDLTHAMEDVLDALRKGELSVTTDMVNRLFEALDTLKAMHEQIAESGISDIACDDLVQNLRAILSGSSLPDTPAREHKQPEGGLTLQEHQREAAWTAIDNGLSVYRFTVRLAEDTLMKSVRALMVLQAIDANGGAVIASHPDEEALDNEQFDLAFELLVATDKPVDSLREVLLQISEVRDVEVTPWQEDASHSQGRKAANAEASPAEEKSQRPPQPVTSPVSTGDAEKTASRAPATSQTIRVDVARLDTLLNLVGELVIDRTRVAQLGREFNMMN